MDMNNTQLIGMRMIYDAMHMSETMTAREMALASHNLNRNGDIATMANGRKFAWSIVLEMWVRYE
jgi:hypothetical protein